MYFWKTESLAAELRNGTLSQKDRFRYLLTFLIITALFADVSYYISEAPSTVAISESTLVVLITIFGTIWCYRTNKSGDDLEFIERFICLSLPVLVRLIVIFLIFYSFYMIVGFYLFEDAFDKFTETTNWVDVGFTILFGLYFYWKLSRAIKGVANNAT